MCQCRNRVSALCTITSATDVMYRYRPVTRYLTHLQSQQDNSISSEDFVGQGLLSLCLRSLAAQDDGLRYSPKRTNTFSPFQSNVNSWGLCFSWLLPVVDCFAFRSESLWTIHHTPLEASVTVASQICVAVVSCVDSHHLDAKEERQKWLCRHTCMEGVHALMQSSRLGSRAEGCSCCPDCCYLLEHCYVKLCGVA